MSSTIPLPFAGKSALVTGATRNISAEIALTLSPFLNAVFVAKKSRASRRL
jgi:NAD(P)-dependent dehydrogenase (short-subunit alcohol dehydrogenase family)